MTRRQIFRAVLLLVLPLALGAQCAVLGPGRDGPQTLEDARRLWLQAGIDDYTLVLRRSCFCIGIEPVQIVVRDGAAVSYTVIESGEALPADQRAWYPTVEGLFTFVEEAREANAARIDVRYDGVRGYPVRIWVDYDEGIADEEMGFEVQAFQPGGG